MMNTIWTFFFFFNYSPFSPSCADELTEKAEGTTDERGCKKEEKFHNLVQRNKDFIWSNGCSFCCQLDCARDFGELKIPCAVFFVPDRYRDNGLYFV